MAATVISNKIAFKLILLLFLDGFCACFFLHRSLIPIRRIGVNSIFYSTES